MAWVPPERYRQTAQFCRTQAKWWQAKADSTPDAVLRNFYETQAADLSRNADIAEREAISEERRRQEEMESDDAA